MKKLFLLFSFFFVLNVSAQQDFRWLKLKNYKIAKLSDSLKETSGLVFRNNKLYTFNDGGNTSEIFEIDKKTGKILNKIKTNLKNFDWEAIATDSVNFYIGDFGNNWGTRRDLKVYKYQNDGNSVEIPFNYPEQNDFSQKPQANNWDAECLILKDGNLHIFTKEWQSNKTTHYKISPENQNAAKLEAYNLGYLATDASYFSGKLYIVGYTKKAEVFLTVFSEDSNGLFFSAKPEKFYLGMATKLGQVEGVAVNNDGIYISAEEFNVKIFHVKQSLYFVPRGNFEKAFR